MSLQLTKHYGTSEVEFSSPEVTKLIVSDLVKTKCINQVADGVTVIQVDFDIDSRYKFIYPTRRHLDQP